jgi:hypothetical protein
MEEDSFNEYFAQKNRIFNQIEDNQVILSDDDIILSDDDTHEYNNLDKMAQFDIDYPIDEDNDEENDIYIRNLILNKMSDNQLYNNFITETPIKQNNTIKKKNNKMKLSDLDTLMNKLEEDKKPKKFVSKRSQEKIQQIHGINKNPVKKIKRTFNPRLVPYFQSNEYKALQNKSFTLDDFPKL